MRKNLVIQIITIVVVVALAIVVAIYFFNQESNVKSVKEDGGTTGVIINEVMSSNSGFLPDEDGDFPDWIELYNPTNKVINLGGFGLSDDEAEPIKYALPDVNILPNGYLIVFASDKSISSAEAPYAHANFKLSSKGDTIIFSNRAGELLDRVDIGAIPTNNALGRNPQNLELLEIFTQATPGFQNSEQGLQDYLNSKRVENPELIITELMTSNRTMVKDNLGQYSDWIEIYNQGVNTINLSDYYISDDPNDPLSFLLPNVELKSGEYYVLYASGDINKTTDITMSVHTDFKLSAFEETVVLSSKVGKTLDTVTAKELTSDYAHQRQLSQGKYTNAWETSMNPSPGFDNTLQGAARYRDENPLTIGSIIINEVVLSNDLFAAESNGEFYDWIEITNRGDQAVNIGGYGLTNNTGNPGKWRFPDLVLRAGEFLLIQASGLGESGKTASEVKKKYLNTNFSLSLDGEIVALFDANNKLIDRYNIEKLPANISAGRQGGSDTIFVFPVPTPGVMNTGGLIGFTPDPKFILEPGFYSGDQTLSLDVPKGTTVYYTLDGSTPTTSSDTYTKSFSLNKTTVVRAMAQTPQLMASTVITGTYFINVAHAVDVISIVTDPHYLWDGKDGIYALGNKVDLNDPRLRGTQFLDGAQSQVLEIKSANDDDPETSIAQDVQAARNAISGANFYIKDMEVPANFALYTGGAQVFSQDIGLQLFGSYSREEVQKSFAMYARGQYGNTEMAYPFFESRDFDTYKTIVARQSGQDCKFSRIRDIFMTSLMEMNSDIVQVQAYRQCVLYLNGDYWGIYNLREKSNKYYASSRYYAPNPEEDIDFLKGNGVALVGSNDDYKALERFMDNNDINLANNYEYVQSQMDVYNFMDWLIAEVYFVNSDDGNRKFYRVRSDDGKWRWLLFDLDWAMWKAPHGSPKQRYQWNYIEEVLSPRGTGSGGAFSTSIARGLMENERWREEFVERYAFFINNTFAPEISVPHLIKLKTNIESEVQHDADVFGWNSIGFTNHISYMQTFLEKRPYYAKLYLQKEMDVSDARMTELFGDWN